MFFSICELHLSDILFRGMHSFCARDELVCRKLDRVACFSVDLWTFLVAVREMLSEMYS